MHEEVLSRNQKELLPLISSFSPQFGLIGGTAVALQIGHRRSVDFDLVTFSQLDTPDVRARIGGKHAIDAVLVDQTHQYTLVIDGVKVTFMAYPFKFNLDIGFKDFVRMPDLLTLAAIKAYALGRRAKWKDYIDLYFIFQSHSFEEVIGRAKKVFGKEFNEKLFREELAYFDDIDYTEEVDFMGGVEVSDQAVKERLGELSLQKT